MKPLFAAVIAAMLPIAAAAQTPPPGPALTPERVFSDPGLSGPSARGAAVSPDGRLLTYLQPEADNQNKLDLWAAPTYGGAARLLVSGQAVEPDAAKLSEAEKGRRERQRLAAVSGVISYAWDDQGRQLLIPAGGDLYLVDVGEAGTAATPTVRKLPAAGGDATDARVSPSGKLITYVRAQNLWIMDPNTGQERAVTHDGAGAISYGVAEFVAQEEMDRYTGYWWAANDRAIAYTRVDETPVDLLPRLEIGADGATIADQRYPRAGRPNAVVSLYVRQIQGVVQMDGAGASDPPVKVDLGPDADIYLARVHWSADGRTLYVERENRAQTQLDLLRVDPLTGESRVILTERQTPWIDLNDNFVALKDGDFIWGSERTGFNHLYLYNRDGKLIRVLTHGAWPVAGSASGAGAHASGVAGVDQVRGLVYFLASKDTPLERQLYVVSYRNPEAPKPVTKGAGWWTAVMSKDATRFIGYYSDPTTPPSSALYDADGRRLRWIVENPLDAGHPFYPYAARYPAPEYGVLPAQDGQALHYILQKPVGFDPAKRYPVIVEVYGGPGVQTVMRNWRGVTEKLYLEAGYVLFQLDNRGSANRGVAFQAPIHLRMGVPEVDDQVVGLDYLRSLPFVDAGRIGVSGWSYGGYMTLRMLTDPRTKLVAGAAGAPPTDWRLYDTHYTERYMGLPQADEAAYDASAVLPRLDRLSGRLLLLQGMSDDNVQFSNSTKVMASLQSMGRPFDLMLYPGQRHGIHGQTRQLQLWRTYLEFFARELGGASPATYGGGSVTP
jgi:dipeptidyl-peptidase-4